MLIASYVTVVSISTCILPVPESVVWSVMCMRTASSPYTFDFRLGKTLILWVQYTCSHWPVTLRDRGIFCVAIEREMS